MQPIDTHEDRTKMVDMHNDIINRIDIAMQEKRYIEACWFCYSCFESRICRTLEKISVHWNQAADRMCAVIKLVWISWPRNFRQSDAWLDQKMV